MTLHSVLTPLWIRAFFFLLKRTACKCSGGLSYGLGGSRTMWCQTHQTSCTLLFVYQEPRPWLLLPATKSAPASPYWSILCCYLGWSESWQLQGLTGCLSFISEAVGRRRLVCPQPCLPTASRQHRYLSVPLGFSTDVVLKFRLLQGSKHAG